MDQNKFIKEHITHRKESLLKTDLETNKAQLQQEITGSNILVIGGAGSIGSAFIKALLPYRPARLVVADINENGLTELVRDLRSTPGQFIPETFLTYPVNFGDPVFAKLFRRLGPFDAVANFAAHKHVRSEKDAFSIEAMFDNNVFRAKGLLDLLTENPPRHFFCVSTDKAANPVNLMGASKKLMEEVILSYARELPVSTARFANVAFSNGSLLAGFQERIARNQPLSVPRGISRYFVSPAESGELCLLACMLGRPGEIFFPKLDPAANLVDFETIARRYIAALGLEVIDCRTEEEARLLAADPAARPGKYPVYFFDSDTSGEKPYEEFHTPEESPDLSRLHALGVIPPKPPKSREAIQTLFTSLKSLFAEEDIDKARIIDAVSAFIPEFAHLETGKNLDSRM